MKEWPKTPQSQSAKHHDVQEVDATQLNPQRDLDAEQKSRIIEMAWEDRTPFEAIEALFGMPEKEVIKLMRAELKRKTFNNWRARVSGRSTKHGALSPEGVTRGYCPTQYKAVRKR